MNTYVLKYFQVPVLYLSIYFYDNFLLFMEMNLSLSWWGFDPFTEFNIELYAV